MIADERLAEVLAEQARLLQRQGDEIAALRMRIIACEQVAVLWQRKLASEASKRRHEEAAK